MLKKLYNFFYNYIIIYRVYLSPFDLIFKFNWQIWLLERFLSMKVCNIIRIYPTTLVLKLMIMFFKPDLSTIFGSGYLFEQSEFFTIKTCQSHLDNTPKNIRILMLISRIIYKFSKKIFQWWIALLLNCVGDIQQKMLTLKRTCRIYS